MLYMSSAQSLMSCFGSLKDKNAEKKANNRGVSCEVAKVI